MSRRVFTMSDALVKRACEHLDEIPNANFDDVQAFLAGERVYRPGRTVSELLAHMAHEEAYRYLAATIGAKCAREVHEKREAVHELRNALGSLGLVRETDAERETRIMEPLTGAESD